MDKKSANKTTVQVYICMCYHEPENARIDRCKQYSWNAQLPLLMLQKQVWVKGYCLFWLILVSWHLLNGQLKQQNVFYCSFTVHNCYFCRCQEAQKIRNHSPCTANNTLSSGLSQCGLWAMDCSTQL